MKILILLTLFFFATSCDTLKPALGQPKEIIGYASYYTFESCRKEGSNGYFTASGERFDENDYTAAIWDLPFNTKLKITNLENGLWILVRINDRGPSKKLVKKGRIIDLSKASFEKLASLSRGIIPVKIEIIK